MGVAAGVGSPAFEVELDRVQGIGDAAIHRCHICLSRMEADGDIQVVKSTAPGHEAFAGEDLFRRTAKIDDRAGQLFLLHLRFQAEDAAQCGSAQQVMAATVAIGLPFNGLFLCCQFLAQAGQRVVFRQKADGGVAGTIGGFDSSGDASGADFNGKAGVCQRVGHPLAGLEFAVWALRVCPDIQGDFFDEGAVVINGFVCSLTKHVVFLPDL